MEIRLIVIRTADTQKIADFYSLLGLTFASHRHGSSPTHYSTTIGSVVLEIYPLAKLQNEADKNLRLGFGIDNFDNTVNMLKDLQVEFSVEPMQTEYGYMTVICDPDGRTIELYKK
jgi:lactoylglutathione lyase